METCRKPLPIFYEKLKPPVHLEPVVSKIQRLLYIGILIAATGFDQVKLPVTFPML